MRVLVLDDDKTRHKTFARNLIGHEKVVHAYTYDDAVEALLSEQFDVVFFDHDLNLLDKVSIHKEEIDYDGKPRELTGADVALFLVSLPEEKHPQYAIVHSYNHHGAENICSILRNNTNCVVLKQIFDKNSGNL